MNFVDMPFLAPRFTKLCGAVALAAALGCGRGEGPQRAAATGSVELDGKPLKAGVVRFIPVGDTQGPAAVATVADGGFELTKSEGPVVGGHRVEIEAIDYFGFALEDEAAFARQIEAAPPAARLKNPVPDAYNRHSTLTAKIEAGKPNPLSFKLYSDGAAHRN